MAIVRIGASVGMSQATVFGGLVYVAGQVAWESPGVVAGEGDPERQAQQVFTNLERVLKDAGCGLADVVKLTCYLTDAAHFAAYAKVKASVFPAEAPASTTVIAQLLDARLLLEVEAVAALPQ